MINNLSNHLYNKIIDAAFPWMDVVAGLVRTQSQEVPTNQDTAATNLERYPVATVHNQTNCTGKELVLIPNGNRKSIIYFEDNGSSATTWLGKPGYSTGIRLIFWCNRKRLFADGYSLITANIELDLINLLAPRKHENAPGFVRLLGEVNRLPVQDAGIFSKYSYKETDKQYLRPPYDFFAIDFTFRYNVGIGCIEPLVYGAATCI